MAIEKPMRLPPLKIVQKAAVKPFRYDAKTYALIEVCRKCKKGKAEHEPIAYEPDGYFCERDSILDSLYGNAHYTRYEPMDNLEILRYAKGEDI